MFSRSISRGPRSPRPTATDFCMIKGKSEFLCLEVKCFESATPGTNSPGGKITAAARTGPARGPRPTSSTPAIRMVPDLSIFFSKNQEKFFGVPTSTRSEVEKLKEFNFSFNPEPKLQFELRTQYSGLFRDQALEAAVSEISRRSFIRAALPLSFLK